MSTHNICFYEEMAKKTFQLSFKYHQIGTLFLLLTVLKRKCFKHMLENQDEKIDEVHTFHDDPKFIEVAVKSLPALIYSVDYIFLLVL